MDVASSAISNVVNTSFPHAAQEARRDALAKETIPQLNQSANSNPNNAVAQGQSQLNPAQSSLFIQAETIIKTQSEKSINKDNKVDKKEGTSTKEAKESSSTKGAASTTSTSGQSLQSPVDGIGQMKAALGGSFGANNGANYSDVFEKKRKKGQGFSGKAIAKTYNSSLPSNNIGTMLDIQS